MRLLVIEDYAPLRESLQRGLSKAGYAVDATGDGNEGLWFAEHNAYDLLIVDLMLPGVDGMTIIRHLRNRDSSLPILILSARDQVQDQVAGLDQGADDYLTKPFAVDELMARIRALLRRRDGQRNPHIELGPVTIDTAARCVRHHGQTAPLTPREYALLEYLVRASDRVVSREELWEHLYDFAAEASSNTLDQWVARARRKLRDIGAPDIIETVHGHGYRASAP